MHGAVGRRADAAEDQQHFLALDQPPRLLHRLRRAVGIIRDDHLDAASVDATVVVHLAEIRLRRFRDLRERRHRAAQRRGGADLDGLVVGAGIVFALGLSRACCEHRQQDAGRAKAGEARHDVVSPKFALRFSRRGVETNDRSYG
ncbi:hypothetical protein ACVWW4_003610 [Bradyrhizobium sp. LB7.1]